MGEEHENFVGAFLVSLKATGHRTLKLFLFLGMIAALVVEYVLLRYAQDMARKTKETNQTWRNHWMKVDEPFRATLELVFVCRCLTCIHNYLKLFFQMPSVSTAVVIAPRICTAAWLMMIGVFYLVVASYDSLTAILTDCLVFEIVFDAESKYYTWSMGDINDSLQKLAEDEDEEENKGEQKPTSPLDGVSVFWPVFRLVSAIGVTLILDAAAMEVANSSTHHTMISFMQDNPRFILDTFTGDRIFNRYEHIVALVKSEL
eukprot:gnl/MRDRNA2_/MRDRNA2_126335_c0_seq1.p1 gnl/MRDRNA2_/MRDRNA2_126335_c0~~gnl/MRDRNA2_/MRDRNA2_126335_c0_seq1.p1  ORF type:complete len:260 (-),score=49.45 gnl/MRDRNA2_/MRDRNA2_126335_c0_seq1:215-994(-)